MVVKVEVVVVVVSMFVVACVVEQLHVVEKSEDVVRSNRPSPSKSPVSYWK